MEAAVASPSRDPIQQLTGRIEDIFPDAGLQPRLRFALTVNNRNKYALELINVVARLHVQFSEEGHSSGPGMGPYVIEAVHDRVFSSGTISSGESNGLSLSVPFPFHVFTEFETARAGRDVIFQLNVALTAIERTPQGDLGTKYLAAELVHERIGGNQFLPLPVPKSRWGTMLNSLGYSEELRGSKQTLLDAVQGALRAKREAEDAARATREASSITGVITLAQAYHEEAGRLRKTSHWWLIAASLLGVVSLTLMGFYVYESFIWAQFTASQTVVRVAVLGGLFAGFGLCMRSYNAYQHLELLNRHRVNIGKTFEIFKSAQPSDKAKDVLAAITAQEMIDFGRGNFPGKDATESQLSLVTEVFKNLVDHSKQ